MSISVDAMQAFQFNEEPSEEFDAVNIIPAPAFSRSTISHVYELVHISQFENLHLTDLQIQIIPDERTGHAHDQYWCHVRPTQERQRMESERTAIDRLR